MPTAPTGITLASAATGINFDNMTAIGFDLAHDGTAGPDDTVTVAIVGATPASLSQPASTASPIAVSAFDLSGLAEGDVVVSPTVTSQDADISSTATETFTEDTVDPTVTGIALLGASPTNDDHVSWEVTFSENVTGVDVSDFELVTVLTGTELDSISGSGQTYTVTASTGAGNGTIGLDLFADGTGIADEVGNPIVVGYTGAIYTIDNAAPSVTAITRDDPNPTNALSVSWTVSFDEAVYDLATTDFDLTGPAGVLSTVMGSGDT